MPSDQHRTLEATVPMAIVDAVPVLLFCVSAALIGVILKSALFWVGVACIVAAGVGKVAWKFVLAIAGRDVALLNRQFRYLIAAGFLVCAVALAIAALE